MKHYTDMTPAELQAEYATVSAAYAELQKQQLSLNISRGKPGKEQLDMVSDIFDVLPSGANFNCDDIDVRNYGTLDGLPAVKKLFAEILGTQPENIFVGGNASLQLMYDTIAKAYTHGLLHSEVPWSRLDEVKWLCPAPGYDRHFKISESFGMKMITVPMLPTGPAMDLVEELVKDPAVKGMWCVPKYSNPDGIVYSDETIQRIASMKTAAPDFLLMWDNAYCVHEFEGEFVPFSDILDVCAKAGNSDRVFEFASTSKITLPGAGVAVMASSLNNLAYMRKLLTVQTIGYDKTNQLRHLLYLKDKAHTLALMKRHAAILGPKFHAVLEILQREIAPRTIAKWQTPKGGYFVSVNAMPGTAKRTLQLCKEAGIVMTDAGATYPYGIDPNDSNMRIAPSLPTVDVLRQALAAYCICLRMAALEKLING